MPVIGRREFLQSFAVSAVALPSAVYLALSAAQAGRAAAVPPFDVIIKGGHVIDPVQKISSVMDVAIAGDKIASVAANIAASSARNVYNAAGKIVTAGLLDSHGHVYDGGITVSIDA